jgi:hypothetical protein
MALSVLGQFTSSAHLAAVGLVEVDCDLGAGTAGAGAGIELLRGALLRQQDPSARVSGPPLRNRHRHRDTPCAPH